MSTQPVKRLEFHVAYECVQLCVFCSESRRLQKFSGKSVSAAEAVRELAKKRRAGFDHVTFTGGEPTALKQLPALLRCAKKLGFRTYLTTNGQFLCEKAAADRILPLLDEICVSIHGPDQATHEALTRAKGGFKKLCRTLENIGAYKGIIYFLANTVATKNNLESLQGILNLALRTGKLRHYLISYPAPEGEGLRNFRSLAVPFEKIAEKIPGLCSAAAKAGVTIRFFGIPACALGKYARFSNDLYFSPRVALERCVARGGVSLKSEAALSPARKRVFLRACGSCAERGRCGGIFGRYLREFGAAGFFPLKKRVRAENMDKEHL